jgi:hypothetical protein
VIPVTLYTVKEDQVLCYEDARHVQVWEMPQHLLRADSGHILRVEAEVVEHRYPIYRVCKQSGEREFFAMDARLESYMRLPFVGEIAELRVALSTTTASLGRAEKRWVDFKALPWWKRCWVAIADKEVNRG